MSHFWFDTIDAVKNDELTQHLNSLKREECYRVDAVLKESPAETTQCVTFLGANGAEQGPYIRKYIKRDTGMGSAYARIFEAQQNGKRFHFIPHILDCYDLDDKHVVVMEYVQGETLADLVYRRDPSLSLAAEVFPLLCDAVSELHEEFDPPIIHRDLKPSNVILSEDSLTIIDFGIARAFNEEANVDTVRFGTRAYAPPEQFGYRQTDVRSDVYALGMLLYYCLTEQTPDAHVHEAGFVDERIPEPMQEVLLKATAFDPEDRYASARELKQAFLDAKEECAKENQYAGANEYAGNYKTEDENKYSDENKRVDEKDTLNTLRSTYSEPEVPPFTFSKDNKTIKKTYKRHKAWKQRESRKQKRSNKQQKASSFSDLSTQQKASSVSDAGAQQEANYSETNTQQDVLNYSGLSTQQEVFNSSASNVQQDTHEQQNSHKQGEFQESKGYRATQETSKKRESSISAPIWLGVLWDIALILLMVMEIVIATDLLLLDSTGEYAEYPLWYNAALYVGIMLMFVAATFAFLDKRLIVRVIPAVKKVQGFKGILFAIIFIVVDFILLVIVSVIGILVTGLTL